MKERSIILLRIIAAHTIAFLDTLSGIYVFNEDCYVTSIYNFGDLHLAIFAKYQVSWIFT